MTLGGVGGEAARVLRRLAGAVVSAPAVVAVVVLDAVVLGGRLFSGRGARGVEPAVIARRQAARRGAGRGEGSAARAPRRALMPPEITDAILPAQFFFRPKPDAFLPEKRLMVAVLAAAVDDYTTYADAKGGSGRRQFANVEAWFASNSARWPFSFVGICEALDLDVSYLRGGLRHAADGAGITAARRQ